MSTYFHKRDAFQRLSPPTEAVWRASHTATKRLQNIKKPDVPNLSPSDSRASSSPPRHLGPRRLACNTLRSAATPKAADLLFHHVVRNLNRSGPYPCLNEWTYRGDLQGGTLKHMSKTGANARMTCAKHACCAKRNKQVHLDVRALPNK